MMSLSTTTGYAIKALVELAEEDGKTLFVRDISVRAGVPAPYLAKIIQRLHAARIVKAKRGHKGGVQLARRPEAITVLDIGKAIDGEDVVGNCLLGKVFCDNLPACPTHPFWGKVGPQIEHELDRWTLRDMVEFIKKCDLRKKGGAASLSAGAGI